jgi:uncharacterized membrane protein YphA (DoxX/SURF4 family)
MNDSMAQRGEGFPPLELPSWKTALSWLSAGVLALLFLASGIWKITDVQGWAQKIAEVGIPQGMSLAASLFFGIAETVGAVLILVPRFRRWGAILLSGLLLAFIIYFALNYDALRGADCSCFPWVKRVVGPEFFVVDALMLALAVCAGVWSKPAGGLRSALVILGAVVVFALVSWGMEAVRQTGVRAPETVAVNGQPYAITRGRVFLFFFNPLCSHCFDAAKRMADYTWNGTRVVAVPVDQQLFADQFLRDSRLNAVVTSDFPKLKQVFRYTAYPFGVAIENGRERAPVTKFEDNEPGVTLKQLGFIQ